MYMHLELTYNIVTYKVVIVTLIDTFITLPYYISITQVFACSVYYYNKFHIVLI